MNNQKLNFLKDPHTNWRYILIVVILAFFISGGILCYQWWRGKEEVKPPPSPEISKLLVSDCENIPFEKEIERTLCFINLGKESKDINLCNQIKDIREKGYCYGGVAGVKKDLTVCLGFQSSEFYKDTSYTPAEIAWLYYRNIPYDLNSAKFSIVNLNPPIIAFPSSDEFEWMVRIFFGAPCYIGAAVVQDDQEVCNWVFASFFLDSSFCQKISATLLAVTKKDPKICDETLNNLKNNREEKFLPLCYGAVGSEIKNPDLCNKINDDELKATCFSYIARTLKDPEICEKIPPESSPLWKDYCFFEVARRQPELRVCNRIKTHPQALDDCYILLAGSLYDESICEKRSELFIEKDDRCEKHFKSRLELVKDSSICESLKKEENKKNCYFYSAQNTKDIGICRKIIDSQTKENCYSKLSKILEEEAVCENIKNADTKSNCYSGFIDLDTHEFELSKEGLKKFSKERAINFCNNIKEEKNKEICWDAAAEALKDLSFCDKLENREALPNRGWCYYKLILLDVELKDPKTCEKLDKIKYYWKDCYQYVAKSLGDVNICNKLDGKDRGYCQAEVAEVLENKSICEVIEDQEPKESCYRSLGGILKDETLCLKIKDQKRQSMCYLEVAKSKKDQLFCEKIYSPGGCWIPDYKHDCYSWFALEFRNPNLCEKIECKHVKDRCFNLLATSQKNLNLCEKIETKSEKEECKSYINTRIKLEEKGWNLGDWELYKNMLSAIEA